MSITGGSEFTPQRDTERGRRHALSPGYRARKSLGGVGNTTMDTEGDIPQNDDEAELRQRQRNRLAEIQQKSLESPGTPGEKRRSLGGKQTVSNATVTEHYANCIKLSAENKINIKNAFQLHLIDYMTDMLRKKDSEMSNFQVASCTLDASAKIYAYRVDCVHSDTLKMAGGLGRSKQTAEEDKKNDEEGGGGEEEQQAPETKKRKAKKSKTVETNLKNINVNKFDLEFEVDPLFKKSSAMFDEGRSGGGQFVTALMMKDDSCQLLLDSDFVFSLSREPLASRNETNVIIPKLDFDDRVICPTFNDFSFLHWDPSREEESIVGGKRKSDVMDSEHAFDLNAPAEPVPELDDLPCPADDFGGLDEIEDEERDGLAPLGSRTPGPIPINRFAVQSTSVLEHLSSVPLEYSYFDKNKNMAWAGPMHLRFRPQKGLLTAPPATEKKKRKKELTALEFEDGVDFTKHLICTKRVISLSNSTLKSWSRDKTTTPEDLHYEVANFYRLFMRSEVSIFLKNPDAVPLGSSEDRKIENYNYENENDVANFCPPPDDDGDANPFDGDTSQFFDEPISQTTPLPPALANGEVPDFLGDALVAAPNKVALIDIGYARTAKKMNMKKLKTAMWAVLTGEKSNGNLRLDAPELLPATMRSPKTFSSLYKEVAEILPNQMRDNLSVPLAFVGFLHLANEHSLALEKREDMSDFAIQQD